MDKINIAVVGSRTFEDYDKMKSILDVFVGIHLEKDICIVSGGAKGADSLGEEYARKNNLEFLCFMPEWGKYGKVAAFLRNKDIVKASDRVVAFWNGKSAGTKHTLDEARRSDIPSYIVNF